MRDDVIHNTGRELPVSIKAAVLDFDGTISTLRCGWEEVMEALFLRHLRQAPLPAEEILNRIRGYIEESTGIQTIFQMEWLARQVKELLGVPPLDPWEYKDEYNRALLAKIRERTERLAAGDEKKEDFLIPGSVAFLRFLRQKGIAIYVASGTDDADVRREAELLGVLPLVQSVKGAPMRKKDCSKEAVIREILERSSLSGSQLLVVGDGKVEIQLGREVGALTIGIASNERQRDGSFQQKKLEKLQKAGADLIVPDFTPLIREPERFFQADAGRC